MVVVVLKAKGMVGVFASVVVVRFFKLVAVGCGFLWLLLVAVNLYSLVR